VACLLGPLAQAAAEGAGLAPESPSQARGSERIEVDLIPVGVAATLPATRGVDALPAPPAQEGAPSQMGATTTRSADGDPTLVWVGDGPPRVPEAGTGAPGRPAVDPAELRSALAALPPPPAHGSPEPEAGVATRDADAAPSQPAADADASPIDESPIHGRAGGEGFRDPLQPEGYRPAVLRIRSAWWVDSVQVIYQDELGHTQEGVVHGGMGGEPHDYQLRPGEYVTHIHGTLNAEYVDSLVIETNQRPASPTFGSGGPERPRETFSIAIPPGHHFVGFHGRSAQYLHAIGVVSAREVDRTARGPGSVTLGLLDEIHPSVNGFKSSEMTNIWRSVYQDQNPASGVYYYLPRRYDLAWDSTNGHHLRVDYKAAGAEGGGGVVMAATLQSGVDSSDVDLMQRLLQAHPNVGGRKVKLQPLPPGSTPLIALGSVWGAPADRIVTSDLTENIQIAWATTAVDIENLRVALSGKGIQGTFSVPIGSSGAKMEGPVSVVLASTATFGRMPWRRDELWQNETPYTVRLRYVHALAIVDGKATVYSWNAGGVRVPPGADASFRGDKVPTWLDSDAALRMWIEYEVDSDCKPCDKVALTSITGGASQTTAQQIVFHTLSLLSRTGAARVKIQVRSNYLDPREQALSAMPIFTLDADDKSFKAPMPIYQPEGATQGAPLFEYRLSLVMPDGAKHEGTNWIPVDALMDEYEVTADDVRRSLGFLPAVATEASGAPQ
jgi:hypothetical protein